LSAPLARASAPDSAAVSRSGDALYFVGPEFRAPDTASINAGEVRWSFDSSLKSVAKAPLIADDGTTVLAAGDTSLSKRIGIHVPLGVTAFRLSLEGAGTYVFTLSRQPPDAVPLEEQRDSHDPDNLVSNDPHFPGRVVRNKLWLLFQKDATPEQRQAVVDAVDGVVVGGMLRGESRYYYLRIPANPDSGAVPLERALRLLAPMPHVQDVMPDIIR
jgi:hypothetical protein